MKSIFDRKRRRLLGGMGAGLAVGSVASLLPQLGLIANAMAATGDGYRALVCVYLGGGNDSFNWLVPRDSELPGSRYDAYRQARGGVYSASNGTGLALDFQALLPLASARLAEPMGLHPACADFTVSAGEASQAHAGLASLFNAGHAAFVANVGTLTRPISKSEYQDGAPRPAQLFSHNDQELLWQLGMSDVHSPLARFGWGGRLAQAGAFGALASGLSSNISLAGAARFLVGDQVLPYQLGSSGVDLPDHYGLGGSATDKARRAALERLLAANRPNLYADEYATTLARALAVGDGLAGELASDAGRIDTLFPTSAVAQQLRMVARMIKVSRTVLGARRQVYFVRMGGFDLHDGMFVAGQPVASSGHGALLGELNQALGAFWSALGEVGAQAEVTAFTMSEFARTLSSNGNGSDHAWGGQQLVLGGNVLGGGVYGRYPQLALDADDDAAQDWSFARGQYIPTTSVDQMAATLSRWMGADENAIDTIFPSLANFDLRDLGFMSAAPSSA